MRDQESDVTAYSFVFQLMCSLLVGLFAVFYGSAMPPIDRLPLNFALMTVLYAMGTLLLFKAYKTTEASRVTILMSSSALWVVIAALIFLGESFSVSKAIGAALILLGVIVVSFHKNIFTSINRGDLYALAAAICYGLAFANDALILREADALSYTSLAFLLPGLLILAVRPKLLRNLRSLLKPSVLFKMSIFAIFYSASAITVYLAYQQGGDAAQLGFISQSVAILTVILAVIFLGEREHLAKKSFAAILATIGVLLLK
jgi:drug/metabolite transporter (DMT)-like permease